MKKKEYISPITNTHDLVVKHHLLLYSVHNLKTDETTTTTVGDAEED